MDNQILAAVTLGKTLACDEPIDRVVDDISTRLGQNGDIHNLKLKSLSSITLMYGKKFILKVSGKKLFTLPPTEICYLTKNLLDDFLDNIQFHDEYMDIEISPKPGFSFENIRTGFETAWEIKAGNISFGKIYERGHFYDRSTDIEIDISILE